MIFTRLMSRKLLTLNFISGSCSSSIGLKNKFAFFSPMKTVVSSQQYFSPAKSLKNGKQQRTKEPTIISKPCLSGKKIAVQPLLACGASPHHPPGSNYLRCLLLNFTISSSCAPIGSITIPRRPVTCKVVSGFIPITV